MTWRQLEKLLVASSGDELETSYVLLQMWERERVETEEMEKALSEGRYPDFLYEDELNAIGVR